MIRTMCGTALLLMQISCLANSRTPVQANPCDHETIRKQHTDEISSARTLCVGNRQYSLTFKNNAVELRADSAHSVLQRIPKGFEPSKVGAEHLISFLSEELQVYRDRNIILYTTAARSTSGSGGGQCGSGAEIYLHALDLKTRHPIVLSSILIGSCKESIELDDQNFGTKQLGAVTVVDGRLALKFLNYKNLEGSPSALLSKDLKTLEFQ